ncbi:MAG: hypothetical protein LBI42_07020 [Chitinispirillales bacterium]|jgi:hypothetical protein|nr:hypothetical protein [Chitinispirillales bacterium]
MTRKLNFTAAAAVAVCAGVSVFGAPGDPHIWQRYNPNISYSFLDDPNKVAMPTRDNIPAGSNYNIQGAKSDGWWTFIWGPRANGHLTANNNRIVRDEIINPMLARMNEEFAYFRDVMGWPVDRLAQQGYRSQIWLYGSGARPNDQADSTAQGGWQSSVNGYPIVLLSWRPVLAFHDASYRAAGFNDAASQTGGVVHEGIHAILASMPDASRIPGWFHEGGNTWLQQQADAQRADRYGSWATLNGPTFMAPFMPIECYSGWLQDGSFGGPNAEGVNRYNSSNQQLCTWRAWLGGNQYGNGFPSFLGEWLGLGSIPWIWMNANGRVLEGMANGKTGSPGLGEEQVRRLITEYRAKQATLDLRNWTQSARTVMNNNFGRNLGPEGNAAGGNWFPNLPAWRATPYAVTTRANDALTPDSLTLPGWSGANQIPLTIPANMDMVTVELMADTANMTLQLCYRAADGTAVYSVPVNGIVGGSVETSIRLDKRPANNVIIAVIASTDYIYRGDATRFAKYKYKIKVPSTVTAADVNIRHYNIDNMVNSPGYPTGQVSIGKDATQNSKVRRSSSFNTAAGKSGSLNVNFSIQSPAPVCFDIYSTAGALVKSVPMGYRAAGEYREVLDMRKFGLSSGTYIIRLRGVPEAGAGTAMFIK